MNTMFRSILTGAVLAGIIGFSACDSNDDDSIKQCDAPYALYMGNNKTLTYLYTLNYPGNTDTNLIRTFESVADGVIREKHTYVSGALTVPSTTTVKQYLKACGKFIAVDSLANNIESSFVGNNFLYHDSVRFGSQWSYWVGTKKYNLQCLDTNQLVVSTNNDSFYTKKISIKNIDSNYTDIFYYHEKYGILKYNGAKVAYILKSKNF